MALSVDAVQARAPEQARFGSYQGVFRPTFLTILGALLYLREGWLVGNGGLLGALLIVVVATTITGITALSASSIATNQRVEAGGAFAIISQALGLEAGGAIGLPLFIAQALSASMYAYAFAEVFTDTWARIGGGPVPLTPVALVAFLGVGVLAWRSTALAFKAQGVLLYLVVAALLSLFSGIFFADLHAPVLLPTTPEVGLVESFAIFFPAATGIMVGVGMSGQLADPRRSIPRGSLWAWGVSTALYLLAAVWFSVMASPAELMSLKTLAFDKASVGVVVRVGLLTSTLMASLSSLVAASKLLQAMSEHRIVPGGRWIALLAPDGEARRALVVTVGIASLGLLTGSLDAVAPIITAFFILTYLALNCVVLLEQRLGMISFRPTFSIPPWVPLVGVVLCSAGLFMASPRIILLLGLAAVVVLYASLSRRHLDTPWETVRSGMDVAVATWAARRVAVHGRTERAWRPDLLVPVTDPSRINILGGLLASIASGSGSVKLLAVGDEPELPQALERLRQGLKGREVFTTSTRLSEVGFATSFPTALDAMQGDLFPPNLVVLDIGTVSEEVLRATRAHCAELGLGLALLAPHERGLGARNTVDVWLSDRSPAWALEIHTANLDLPVLVGLLVARSWEGRLNLVTAVREDASLDDARRFLREVAYSCRLPPTTGMAASAGPFLERLRERPAADLHLMGMPPDVRREHLLALAEAAGGVCLFLMDSGRESALA